MAKHKLIISCVLFPLVGIGVSSAARALLNYENVTPTPPPPPPPWFRPMCPMGPCHGIRGGNEAPGGPGEGASRGHGEGELVVEQLVPTPGPG
ncbi:hypothetical protein TIFTF001_044438 [Ficus carica]|uniref:Uncharacterized protein n=1 Tax=Ficus carica TaxID=3494 RepID=A0AA88CST9_FICCA|nr:hypothetical protein TIFTF001_044438 [Ficus carica]